MRHLTFDYGVNRTHWDFFPAICLHIFGNIRVVDIAMLCWYFEITWEVLGEDRS